jgi:hypothetical protein
MEVPKSLLEMLEVASHHLEGDRRRVSYAFAKLRQHKKSAVLDAEDHVLWIELRRVDFDARVSAMSDSIFTTFHATAEHPTKLAGCSARQHGERRSKEGDVAMDALKVYELYEQGDPVLAPWEDDDRLKDLLYEEEYDFDYRAITFAINEVDCDLSLEPNPGNDPDCEAERFQIVLDWVADIGGYENAFRRKPPLLMLNDAGCFLADGRHRLACAWQAGEREARMVVGAPKGYVPTTRVAAVG